MPKPTIVTRAGKGSALTWTEGDTNLTNLRDATVTVAGDSGTSQAIELNGTITVAGGTGLSSAMTTNTVTLNLDNTAVTPASYTNANITVDAQGRITSASNGTDNNTTYAISAETATGGVNLRLTGSDTTTDDVKLAAGTNITLTRTDASTITIASTASGSMTSFTVAADSGASQTINDGNTLTIVGGTNITSVASATDTVTLNLDATLTGLTAITATTVNTDAIVGVATNGNITITPNGTGDVLVDADTLRVGDTNATATVTSNGTGDLVLSTNSGTNSGTITITNGANGNITLAPNGTGIVRSDKSIQIQASGEIRLADSDSSNYVGFKSPTTVSTNKIWTLPSADGTSGQMLSTDGSGALSWATAAAGKPFFGFTQNGVTETTDWVTISGDTRKLYITESFDTDNIFSIDANYRFSLTAGTYLIHLPSHLLLGSTIFTVIFYNYTDSEDLFSASATLTSTSGYRYFMPRSIIYSPTATKTIELRQTTANISCIQPLGAGTYKAPFTFIKLA